MRTTDLLINPFIMFADGEGTPAPVAAPVAAPPSVAAAIGGEVSPLGGAPSGASTESGTSTESGAESASGTDSGTEGADSLSGTDSGTDVVYDLKLPEGVELDNDALTGFQETAQKHGLSNDAAQALLDQHLAQLTKVGGEFVTKQNEAWKTTIDGWKETLAANPEFAGAKMQEAQVIIGRALDEYGGEGVREAFELTGAGWNPAIVTLVYNMAKLLNEGTPTPPGRPPANPKGPRTIAGTLYPEGT